MKSHFIISSLPWITFLSFASSPPPRIWSLGTLCFFGFIWFYFMREAWTEITWVFQKLGTQFHRLRKPIYWDTLGYGSAVMTQCACYIDRILAKGVQDIRDTRVPETQEIWSVLSHSVPYTKDIIFLLVFAMPKITVSLSLGLFSPFFYKLTSNIFISASFEFFLPIWCHHMLSFNIFLALCN